MASIADLLQEYSKESSVEDETTIPVPEPVSEVIDEGEDTIPTDDDVGEALAGELESFESSINVMADAAFSFESSVDFLDKLRDDTGELTDTSLRLFNASIIESMESRGIPLDVLGDEIVFSAEASDKDGDGEKKKGNFFQRIWAMIKAAFQRVREWIVRFAAWFGKSASAVRKAAQKLKTRAEEKKSSGAKADEEKFNAAPFNDLIVGGKVDAIKSVERLRETSSLVFRSAHDLLNEGKSAADTLKSPVDSESWWGKMVGLLAGKKKAFAGALNTVKSSPLMSDLPGGRKFVVDVEDTKKGLKAKVRVIQEGQKEKVNEKMMSVLSLDEIIRLADAIIKLVDTVERDINDFEKKNKSYNLGEIKNIPIDPSHGGDTAAVRELVALVTQGSMVAQSMTSNISRIIFPIAKRAYALGAVNVRRYK